MRVAGIPYLSTRPYRLLAELPFIKYEENSPAENARRLHEREVDIALIPASELAVHGGYVGLDYGLACAGQADTLTLMARGPVSELSTIFIYEDAICSAVLLSILLRECWHVTPRLVRSSADLDPMRLQKHEGAMLRWDGPAQTVPPGLNSISLVNEWSKLSGHDFVFLVWAMRPGTVSLSQLRLLQETFQRAATACGAVAEQYPEASQLPEGVLAKFLCLDYRYYLDDELKEALDLFLNKASQYSLLPAAEYHSAKFGLLTQRSSGILREPKLETVMAKALGGERLSVRDGLRLAEEVSFGDLGLVATNRRQTLFGPGTVRYVLKASAEALARPRNFDFDLEEAIKTGVGHLVIDFSNPDQLELERLVRLLCHLKARFPIVIEALTPRELLALGMQSGLSTREVISQLVTAGLNVVSSAGGGMLVERVKGARDELGCRAEEWLDTIKWVHRFGASSTCCLRLGCGESWEDRMVHLDKLRTLQDENPGFKSFFLDVRPNDRVDIEIRLRALMLARLFLDNISVFEETGDISSEIGSSFGLALGSNEVRLNLQPGGQDAAISQGKLLQGVFGLSIPDSTGRIASEPPEVH